MLEMVELVLDARDTLRPSESFLIINDEPIDVFASHRSSRNAIGAFLFRNQYQMAIAVIGQIPNRIFQFLIESTRIYKYYY